MIKKLFPLIFIAALSSCQSIKESPPVPLVQEEHVITPCEQYATEYEKLKEIVSSLDLTNFSYNELSESEVRIFMSLRLLDEYTCSWKKDTKFASDALTEIRSRKPAFEKEAKIRAEEGEDLQMDGLSISSSRVIFNENIEPSIEIHLNNNTKVPIKALVFEVQYCEDLDRSSMVKYVADECLDYPVMKDKVEAFTKQTYICKLDASKLKSPSQTKVIIYKIVRGDGRMIKRINHKGLGVD